LAAAPLQYGRLHQCLYGGFPLCGNDFQVVGYVGVQSYHFDLVYRHVYKYTEVMTTNTTQDAYDEATASARKAFHEAIAPASKVYDEAIAAARKAYDEAIAPARKAYEDAVATARKARDEAIAASGKANEEVGR
jgi:hypothetical protein